MKQDREYENDFTRGSSSFWFLVQQNFQRIVRWTCLENVKTRKKRLKKTKHVLGHAWFKKKKLKKNHVCSSYLGGIFFKLFFFLMFLIKSDEHGWVFFSYKKKN